jgi:hypothetical protein
MLYIEGSLYLTAAAPGGVDVPERQAGLLSGAGQGCSAQVHSRRAALLKVHRQTG